MLRTGGGRAAGTAVETADDAAEAVCGIAHPLKSAKDLDPLIEHIGDAKFVLLGEASHGTHEYYTWRAMISQRLILEKGFRFIAVEGDWPDCYSVNRYIKGYPDSGNSAGEVLHKFERWPTWMWANWEISAFAQWLRIHNNGLPANEKIGFYGLDVYSLWDSMREIVSYLERVDPGSVELAKRAIHCFEPYGEEGREYAMAMAFVPESCERDVIQLLTDIKNRARQYSDDGEAAFNAEQNALVALNAERYYRTMIRGGADSWNIRDIHMADTLDRLMRFHGADARCIVWEHNTHIGDARATDMVEQGEVNVGQLTRERHSYDGVVLAGFGSYKGSVIAAEAWGAPMMKMHVPPAEEGSWEDVMHRASHHDKLLILSDQISNPRFADHRGHRAIGVIYNPNYEAFGNYVPTSLARRYNAFLYLDETTALHPMHLEPTVTPEPPETYPFGI